MQPEAELASVSAHLADSCFPQDEVIVAAFSRTHLSWLCTVQKREIAVQNRSIVFQIIVLVSLRVFLNQCSGQSPEFIRVFKLIVISSYGKAVSLKPGTIARAVIHVKDNQRIPVRNAHTCRRAKLYSRDRVPQCLHFLRIRCSEL